MTYSRDEEETEDPMIKFTHSIKAHTMGNNNIASEGAKGAFLTLRKGSSMK